MLNDKSKMIENISAIDKREMELIKAFLQGAVYCWVKNIKDEVFALRDLVGGENNNWENTPLELLYKKHSNEKNNKSANIAAGQDAGKILKLVLSEDKIVFEVSDAGHTNGYKRINQNI